MQKKDKDGTMVSNNLISKLDQYIDEEERWEELGDIVKLTLAKKIRMMAARAAPPYPIDMDQLHYLRSIAYHKGILG